MDQTRPVHAARRPPTQSMCSHKHANFWSTAVILGGIFDDCVVLRRGWPVETAINLITESRAIGDATGFTATRRSIHGASTRPMTSPTASRAAGAREDTGKKLSAVEWRRRRRRLTTTNLHARWREATAPDYRHSADQPNELEARSRTARELNWTRVLNI